VESPSVLLTGRAVRIGVVLLLCAVLLPIALPFAHPDFPQGHDASAHLSNTFRFDRALMQGQWPVRWVEGIRPGSGQPLFNFYQVGFYYLAELFHAAGLPLSVAFKAMPVLLWWLGSLFLFLLLRPYGLLAAAAGTVTFSLSPYMIVDVFVRAAYPELAGIVFGIGTLWATDAFIRSGERAHLALSALLFAATLLCHLPAALMMAPMLVAHLAVLVTSRRDNRSRLPWLGVALVGGVGLAAFYVLPAIAEMSQVSMRRLTEGGADYHRHFVPVHQWVGYLWSYAWNYRGSSISDPADLMPVHISLVQWCAVIGGLGLLAFRLVRRSVADRTLEIAAWLVIVAMGLFMMSGASVRLWDAFPALAFIQFPWRFFLLISIAGGVLIAMFISRLPIIVQAVALVLVVGVQVHLYERRLHPDSYITRAEMNIDDPRWAGTPDSYRMAHHESGYDPIGTTPDPAVTERWSVVSGTADIRPVRLDDASIVLAVTGASEALVRVNTPYFPGWHLSLDGRPVSTDGSPASGYMQVGVPGGLHILEATFSNTLVRRVANVTSVGSILLLSLFVISYEPVAYRGAPRRPSFDSAARAGWSRLLRG
jgi:hypothetical protein